MDQKSYLYILKSRLNVQFQSKPTLWQYSWMKNVALIIYLHWNFLRVIISYMDIQTQLVEKHIWMKRAVWLVLTFPSLYCCRSIMVPLSLMQLKRGQYFAANLNVRVQVETNALRDLCSVDEILFYLFSLFFFKSCNISIAVSIFLCFLWDQKLFAYLCWLIKFILF